MHVQREGYLSSQGAPLAEECTGGLGPDGLTLADIPRKE